MSTRVLSPRYAVIWAAFFNFVAFLIFSTHVANTIAKDVVVQSALTVGVIFAGLVGAIAWNLLTFWLGLPTSSSHALVAWQVLRSRVGIRCPDLRRAGDHRRLYRALPVGRARYRAVVDRDHPVAVSPDKNIDD